MVASSVIQPLDLVIKIWHIREYIRYVWEYNVNI